MMRLTGLAEILAGCALFGAVMLSLGGCAAGGMAAYQVRSFEPGKIVPNAMVTREVRIKERSETTTNGLLSLQITLESRATEPRTFEYRFRWLGPGNREITSQLSQWQTVTVEARDLANVTGLAPDAGAESYMFEIRIPQRW
jgi:hypothetical protein